MESKIIFTMLFIQRHNHLSDHIALLFRKIKKMAKALYLVEWRCFPTMLF
ncbi:hypothetical protein INT80_03145 [Gallibacterium anatis]|uniref:Uncharacterized protein n=1 Tax=Gallibacterium anatis TaxID=750 RepID=A0A930Y8D4_9PAST|nr:hypothetical protein [Gallibacterium anatis]